VRLDVETLWPAPLNEMTGHDGRGPMTSGDPKE